MTIPTIPMVNLGNLYIQKLQLTNTSTTVTAIAAGQARNSTNINDIVVSAALAVSTAVNGANGLDTGTVANSTFYSVFVVGDSTGYNASCGLYSLSATAPTLPAGYDMFRRIGYVLTDGSAHILPFLQRGNGLDREMWYSTIIASTITNGSSSTFAAADFSGSVPPQATDIIMLTAFTPTAASNTLNLKATGVTSTNGQIIISGDVAAVLHTSVVRCPCNVAASVDYKVTGTTVALSTIAYVDQL
jgi:hypothetical protein